MRTALLISAIFLSCLLITSVLAAGIPAGMGKATFAVHCYDVGASALDGKPGVVSVERGWSGAREVDRVVYDPKQVSLEKLESWLRSADTYISTLDLTMATTPEKEMAQ